MENSPRFTIAKINLILMVVGILIIIIGFFLMGGKPTETTFNPEIFSFRRITVGPMTSFFGFLFIIFAILYKSKSTK